MNGSQEGVSLQENDKNIVRKKFLKIRDDMPFEERMHKSREIMDKFLHTELYRKCDRVFCYISFRSEVDTRELLEKMIQDGKRVCVPRVEGREMMFYEISGLADCERGSYGILEPLKGRKPVLISETMDKNHTKDLMIVPGSVFSVKKERMGYGGGYYDRFLEKNPMCTVGFFFDCQKTDMLPCEQYDKKLSYILTETMFL